MSTIPAPIALSDAAQENAARPLDEAVPARPDGPAAPSRGTAPLLFAFLLPLLAVVGLVLWIGSSVSWLAVGVTIAAIACFTGLVLIPLSRLLDDEDGARR